MSNNVDAGGEPSRVYARREVILSASAIASPAILQRSGVGDADALRKSGITPFRDLREVGRNFHDDLGCGFPVFAEQALPPTPFGFLGAGLFACDSGNPHSDPAGFGEINLELQISTSNMAGPPHSHMIPYALIGASAMHLDSRGTVSLDPADPFSHPLVDPAWLSVHGVSGLRVIDASVAPTPVTGNTAGVS